MQPTQRTTFSLVSLLTVLAAGVAGWLISEATHGERPPRAPHAAGADTSLPVRGEPPPLTQVLHAVHLGMPRAVAEDRMRGAGPGEEELVGPPDGPRQYLVRYRMYLLRPHPQMDRPGAFQPGPHVVTLAFDAGHPSQPLLLISAAPEEP